MKTIDINSKVEKLKIFLENQKSLIPIILLIPTLIGGIWQILELMFIDPSFIRFFSSTQLISDGILILTLITILIVYIYFLNKQFKFNEIGKFSEEKPYFNHKKLIISISVISITCFFYYIGFRELGLRTIKTSRIGGLLIQVLSAGFFIPILLDALITFSYETFKLYFGDKPKLLMKWRQQLDEEKGGIYFIISLISSIAMFMILGFIILLGILLIGFRNKIIYPENLENMKNISNQVFTEYGKEQKFSILYFNDKYIFVELENKDENSPTKIKIYKTDEILFK